MPNGYEVHSAKLVDVPAIRRAAEKGIALDSEMAYTRDLDSSRSAVLSSVLLPQRGLYTLVGKADKQTVAGQVRIKYADRLAQIVYVAPECEAEASTTAWLALLDAMAQEAGRRGATMLTAEVDEISPLFEILRQTGFAVYARQEIWRRYEPLDTLPRLPALIGDLADETDDDTLDIQLLYSNIVPRLVQPIAVPSPESVGMVYRRDGRVQAYIAVSQGKQGIYLMPFMHPDVLGREAAAIVAGVLARIDKTDRTPVYVCVRRYQDWLDDSLRDLGFTSWTQQAVMVRHIAASIRQPAFALPAQAALEGIPSTVTSPFHQSTLDHDTGDGSSRMERRITDDIQELKQILPPHIRAKLDELGHTDELLEIVLDLGRIPTARYISGEVALSEKEVTRAELDSVEDGVGSFDADNRAGMERTLHRISAIRNRRGEIVGLTCRVGRAVYGTIDIIQDLVESGQSILMMGPPGVGKTTMLREAARVLAETKRVVIVDTSNEIGGDGDVPHPAIGKARRMQVSHPERQHEVMIEAVENHNPEVIVIDEIGRELEATAARTIAERGVQLIGTAHGNALDNLMLNPTLSDLVGGIQSVTLSDEEARRRGTQKTVLERRAPPTFDVLIELQNRDRMIVHEDVAAAVDSILRERPLPVEIRYRDENGEINIESAPNETRMLNDRNERNRSEGYRGERPSRGERGRSREYGNGNREQNGNGRSEASYARETREGNGESRTTPTRIYAYGVARNRLIQAARRLHVQVSIVDDPGQADLILTLKNYYRRRPKLIVDAERAGRGIYVLRANTVSQMENFLMDVFHKEADISSEEGDPFSGAMREVQQAIVKVRSGVNHVDLAPQANAIRRRQHELARRAELDSQSFGSEPHRFVRVMKPAS